MKKYLLSVIRAGKAVIVLTSIPTSVMTEILNKAEKHLKSNKKKKKTFSTKK